MATHTTVNRHVNFPFSIINSQLLQIAKCNLSLQHLLRDQPQIGQSFSQESFHAVLAMYQMLLRGVKPKRELYYTDLRLITQEML